MTPLWTPEEKERITSKEVIDSFGNAFRHKFHIDYITSTKDVPAAQKIAALTRDMRDLDEFMQYGVEMVAKDEYWGKRISIHAITFMMNDIRVRMVRDKMEAQESHASNVSDKVKAARKFWDNVREEGENNCVRCKGGGFLSWTTVSYDGKHATYGGRCSCKPAGEVPHYDDCRGGTTAWHNSDFLYWESAHITGVDSKNYEAVGKELCSLFRKGGGTYTPPLPGSRQEASDAIQSLIQEG